MADREGVRNSDSVSQAGSDEEEEEVKRLSSLMDRLRHKDKTGHLKSWQDTTKSLKLSVLDKHPGPEPDEKSALQRELSALTKIVKVNSISSLVLQLEQCGKHVGLNLVTMSGSNRVVLKSDMFEVQVSMETSGKVKDVVINHEGVPNSRDSQLHEEASRRELTKLLCDNNFGEFTRHLEGLASVFSVPGDKTQRIKAFNALQFLETDLNMLSKMQSTITCVANYIHKSPLGILQPRIGGMPMQMTYFVGPYDLLCPQSVSCCPMTVEAIIEKKLGYRVSVGVMPSNVRSLQTMPLIMDGKSIPSFSAMNKVNSCTLPAVFVLRLHEQMPMAWSLIQKITTATGVDFVDKKKLKSLMSLLIQHVRKKDLLDGANQHGLHVHLPDQRHSYFLHPWPGGSSGLEGAMVREIPFTHPTHVAAIINCLRQQVLFNTVISSCVRNAAPHNGESCWTFELIQGSLSSLTVSFEHPYSDSIAAVEIDLTDVTGVKCHIIADTSASDTPQEAFCSDESATKVLQRCLSLPVTLRWILHQALAHLQKKLSSPSSTPSCDLGTPHAVHGVTLRDLATRSGMSSVGQERRQAFIDAHLRNQLPWKHMNNNMLRIYSVGALTMSTCRNSPPGQSTNTTNSSPPLPGMPIDISPSEPVPSAQEPSFDHFIQTTPMEVDESDKVSRNPMLASLLGQDTKSPSSSPNNGQDDTISPLGGGGGGLNPPHQSMLSALLGDSSSPPVQKQVQYQSPQHQPPQYQQRSAPHQQLQNQHHQAPGGQLQQTPLQQQLSSSNQGHQSPQLSHLHTSPHLQQQLSSQSPQVQHQSPLHQASNQTAVNQGLPGGQSQIPQTGGSSQGQGGHMGQSHYSGMQHHQQQHQSTSQEQAQLMHQQQQHPAHLPHFQPPLPSQARTPYQQPFPPSAKKARKRRSAGDHIGDPPKVGRPPKRKASEEDIRRDLTMLNVDGSSSTCNSMDVMATLKPISQCGGVTTVSSVLCSDDVALKSSSLTPNLPSSSPSSVSTCSSNASFASARSASESHVNRLASTMDSIIKQEARTQSSVAGQLSVGSTDSLGSLLSKDNKRFKSESDTAIAKQSSEDLPASASGKVFRCYSESEGAFANSNLGLKTVLKTEKPDPFDFAASVPSSKDVIPDGTGGKVLKVEPKVDVYQKDLSLKNKNDHEKPVVTFDKAASLDSIKSEVQLKHKERRKDKRETKDSLSFDDRSVDKEKPPAITVKLNTRELTARTIIKESPVHNSTSQDGCETSWKEKVKDGKSRGTSSTDACAIDLTAELESDKSSSSSTPSHGRVTPGSTPNASPRILQVGSLKRPNKEKSRGEKRRRSTKHNVEGDTDKKHKKHNDEIRKEQLSKKQKIYDFEPDANETDNYRVEKLPSRPSTTIKIRANKITSKNSPISPTGGRSPNLSKLGGGTAPLKIVKSIGENSKLSTSSATKQRSQGSSVQRTCARSKLDNAASGVAASSTNSSSSSSEKVDSKLNRIATIKLKPLNMATSATVTVTPTTASGAKTTQSPSSAPVATATKASAGVSSTSSGAGSTGSTTQKSTKTVQSKKLLAVIDKLKKQQTTSPSGGTDGRDSDTPSGRNQAIYDAIRLQIIREGNKPSTPTKEILSTNLKSSHNKKDSSSKSDSFKKSDFSKSGAMPSVNTSSLGTIPKTSSSQNARHNSSNNNSTTNSGSITTKNSNSTTTTAPVTSNSKPPAVHSVPSTHKITNTVASSEPNTKLPTDNVNNKKDAVSIIASKDPRTAAHLNNKLPPSNAGTPSASIIAKDTPPPGVPNRNQPAPSVAQTNKKSIKLDDISERLQKNPRHFLDAVKLPVNGSPGQGQGNEPEDSERTTTVNDARVQGNGHDVDPSKPEHPNHEIFTENPSSPTDDMEDGLASARVPPVVGYVSDSRVPPSAEHTPKTTDTSQSVSTAERAQTDNKETLRNHSDGPHEKSNQVPNSKDLKADSIASTNSWAKTSEGPGKEMMDSTKELPASLHNSTPAAKPSILKNSTTTYSKSSPGPKPATPVTVNNISSETKVKVDSPTVASRATGISNKPSSAAQSMLRVPCSPVSSPEDGLIIDDGLGSPKSSQSPGATMIDTSLRNHTPSPSCAMRPIQSPVPRGPSPALLEKVSPQRRLTPTSIGSGPRTLHSRSSASSGSPSGFHDSPVGIDDDLMNEALMM